MKQNIFLVNLEKKEKYKCLDNDINNIKIKDLFNDEYNKKCIDCNRLYPENISINNGVFLCNKCAENHLKLKTNVSKVIKFILAELSIQDIRYIFYGGNKKLLDFIEYEYPCLKLLSNEKKYNTRAMEYYRANLKYLVEGGEKPEKPSREGGYILSPKIENDNIIPSIKNLTIKKLDFNEVNNNSNEDNDENVIFIDFRNHQHYIEKKNSTNLTEIINSDSKLDKNNNKNIIIKSKKISDLSFSNKIPQKKIKNEIKLTKKFDNENKFLNINFKNNRSIDDIIINNNKTTTNKQNNKNCNRNNFRNSYNNEKQQSRKINIKFKEINLKDWEINPEFCKTTNNFNNIQITNNNTIYSKPKHTLLNVFKKNIPNKNKTIIKDQFTEPKLVNSLSNKNISTSKKNNKDNKSFDFSYNESKEKRKTRNFININDINNAEFCKTQNNFYNLNKNSINEEKYNTIEIKNNKNKVVFKKKAIQNKIGSNINQKLKKKIYYKNIRTNTPNKPSQYSSASKINIHENDNILFNNINNKFNTLTKDLNDYYETEMYTERLKINNNNKEYVNHTKLSSFENCAVKNIFVPPLNFYENNEPEEDSNMFCVSKNNIKLDLKSLVLTERYKKMQKSLDREKKANQNESKDNTTNYIINYKFFKKKNK